MVYRHVRVARPNGANRARAGVGDFGVHTEKSDRQDNFLERSAGWIACSDAVSGKLHRRFERVREQDAADGRGSRQVGDSVCGEGEEHTGGNRAAVARKWRRLLGGATGTGVPERAAETVAGCGAATQSAVYDIE